MTSVENQSNCDQENACRGKRRGSRRSRDRKGDHRTVLDLKSKEILSFLLLYLLKNLFCDFEIIGLVQKDISLGRLNFCYTIISVGRFPKSIIPSSSVVSFREV